jgi:hypothetical protein
MCALLSLEVRCKRLKKKKTFVFECYNLMDLMELGAVIF